MTVLEFTVTDADTSLALGSGDVPVLATPRLLAWVEAATVRAAAELVDPSSTTVGTEVWLRHRRPSPVGGRVRIEVTSVGETDRGLAFEAVATHPEDPASGRATVEIARARVLRAVVDRDAFVAAAVPRPPAAD